MNNDFQIYNKAVVSAFNELIKTEDLIARKTENFLKILRGYNDIKTVLCTGYNPVALGLQKEGYDISLLDSSEEMGPPFVPFDINIRYDAVLALDEYITFASDETAQKDLLNTVCDLTKAVLIVTLSDYKNMSENTKDYSDPQGYKTKEGYTTYLEKHTKGRNHFLTKVYKIDHNDNLTIFGPVGRRSMYFKQLARQAENNKSIKFLFQKNMMYKGMLKKNYEHIITIDF